MAGTAAGPAQRYLEQLSDADLALLGVAAGLVDPGTRPRRRWRRPRRRLRPSGRRPSPWAWAIRTTSSAPPGCCATHPELVEPALSSPGAFQWLFPEEAETAEVTVAASPLLLFAVAVHRGVADLAASSFAGEPFGGLAAHPRLRHRRPAGPLRGPRPPAVRGRAPRLLHPGRLGADVGPRRAGPAAAGSATPRSTRPGWPACSTSSTRTTSRASTGAWATWRCSCAASSPTGPGGPPPTR